MQITPSFCVVVQAAAVAQCDVLLGPHGAGLAHLAFMTRDLFDTREAVDQADDARRPTKRNISIRAQAQPRASTDPLLPLDDLGLGSAGDFGGGGGDGGGGGGGGGGEGSFDRFDPRAPANHPEAATTRPVGDRFVGAVVRTRQGSQ